MALDESEKEQLRTLLVETILDMRRTFLANGGKVLTHWDRLYSALQTAAAESGTPEEWVTGFASMLGIGAPVKASCQGSIDLASFVAERKCAQAFRSLLAREHSYLMALARLTAQKRREDHDNETGEVTA